MGRSGDPSGGRVLPEIALLCALDAELFARIRALNSDNHPVAGVSIHDPEHAAELYGRGDVRAAFGDLRTGVMAFDIDLPSPTGDAVVEDIARWALARRVAHLIRPSGGGPGRYHVLLITDGREKSVQELARSLRGTYRASKTAIDLRTPLRLLSSPHRNTGRIEAPLGGTDALYEFLIAVRDLPKRWRKNGGKRTIRVRPTARTGGSTRPPQCRSGRTQIRPIPPDRQAWLDGGPRPHINGDSSDSTLEVIVLTDLIRCGMDFETARKRITTDWAQALPRLAQDEARMWSMWARGVDEDDLHRMCLESHRAGLDAAATQERIKVAAPWLLEHGQRHDPGVFAAVYAQIVRDYEDYLKSTGVAEDEAERDLEEVLVAAYHRLLDELLWLVPERRRGTRFTIAAALLARAQRVGSLRVPCPERDLHIDTGLDRKTIRAAWAELHRVGFGRRIESFLPDGTGTRSHEFEITPASPGVGQIPPP